MTKLSSTNPIQIERQLAEIAQQSLPDYKPLLKQACETASQVELGRSAFLHAYDCASELEYKRQCMKDGHIMYHAHIGMNDMQATAQALRHIHSHLDEQGFRMDRAGVAIDRRMGLPQELRQKAPAETGPMLDTVEDWTSLAQSAPIQPNKAMALAVSTLVVILSFHPGASKVKNCDKLPTVVQPMRRA